MDTYKQKFTKLEQKVFRFLCIHAGQEFHIRSIARHLNVSATGISKVIKKFDRFNLINIDKEFLLRVRLNRTQKVMNLKRVDNLKLLYETGFVSYVSEKFPGTTIIVFGSYSFGEDTFYPKSDIDIAIVGAKEVQVSLNDFQKLLGRDINILFFQNFRKIETNLRDNILNGIVLKGYVEL